MSKHSNEKLLSISCVIFFVLNSSRKFNKLNSAIAPPLVKGFRRRLRVLINPAVIFKLYVRSIVAAVI